MNIAREVVRYMEDELGLGSFGQDLFVGGAPKGSKNAIWWVLSAGGTVETDTFTGEKIKNYLVDVFHRDINEEAFYENLEAFETSINSAECPTLVGYEVIDITASSFPTDDDLDLEDRKVGLVQLTVRTYL